MQFVLQRKITRSIISVPHWSLNGQGIICSMHIVYSCRESLTNNCTVTKTTCIMRLERAVKKAQNTTIFSLVYAFFIRSPSLQFNCLKWGDCKSSHYLGYWQNHQTWMHVNLHKAWIHNNCYTIQLTWLMEAQCHWKAVQFLYGTYTWCVTMNCPVHNLCSETSFVICLSIFLPVMV